MKRGILWGIFISWSLTIQAFNVHINTYLVKQIPTLSTTLDSSFYTFFSYFSIKDKDTFHILKAYDKSSYRLNQHILLLVDYVNELDTTVTLQLYSNKDRYNFVGEVVSTNGNVVLYKPSKSIQSNKQFITITLLPKQILHACLAYQPISFKDYYFKRNSNDFYVFKTKYHFPVFDSFYYKRNIGYNIQYFVLLGVILIMLIFYLLANYYLHDKIYLYYSFYLLYTFLQVLYMVQYEMSRNMVMFNFVGNSGFDEATKGLMIYFYTQFYKEVFGITKKQKYSYYAAELLKITCVVYVAIIVIAYVFRAGWYPEIAIYRLYRFPVFFFSLIIIFNSFWQKKMSYFQKIILSGSVVYMFFNMLSIIQKTDFLLEDLLLQTNTLYMGILLELIFFSVALIIRIKDSFLESEALKDKLIVELQQNEEFISNQNILLENKVKERVQEIKQQNLLIEEQKTEALVQSFEKERAQIQLQALTSQLNPHFIFNSMNAIHNAVVSNNTKKASRMLTDFSALIRTVLENSMEAKISLENEIKLLETYLKLEQIRTSNSFEYQINIDHAIAADFIEIPTMMLQPFLENAIWHGFKGIDYKGKIRIVFSLSEDVIHCEITDNGIGRKSASEKLYTPKKSLAIHIIQNRIILINKAEKAEKATLTIVDLLDEQKNAMGTKVIIRLPIL